MLLLSLSFSLRLTHPSPSLLSLSRHDHHHFSPLRRALQAEKARGAQLAAALLDTVKYEIEVRTGKSKGSATDARVYLEMHGAGRHEGRSSGELRLLPDDGTRLLPPFQRGATDTFEVSCPDVGLPTRLRVWHDNTGRHPDWKLEHLKIRRKARKRLTLFGFWLCCCCSLAAACCRWRCLAAAAAACCWAASAHFAVAAAVC